MSVRGSRRGGKSSVTVLLALLVGLSAVFLFGVMARGAGALPAGFVQSRFAGGFADPTTMAFAPDGRLFVAEQRGTLRIVKDGRLLGAPFVNLSAKIDASGERGLLGVALDPQFAANRYVYVYYTQKATGSTPAHNRVGRFVANGDTAAPGSERTIMRLPNLVAKNHNGGAIHFGKDGRLYVAVGDNARREFAPSLDSRFGKILRVNRDGSIPSDNPYYRNTRVKGLNKAIWARGLRNPYSFDIQPGTGRIHINDVGWQRWEEVNVGARGANYGWPSYEGPSGPSPLVRPIHAYRHGSSANTGCAITGGAFYNPPASAPYAFPASYVGDYYFADFCSGWIRKLDLATKGVTTFKAASDERPVDLKVGPEGDLYYLTRSAGSVERISYAGN